MKSCALQVLAVISACFLSFSVHASNLGEAKQRCQPPLDGEPVVYQNDFSWGYELDAMKARFKFIYRSGKRLKQRAFYDPAQGAFVFPVDGLGGKQIIVIPERFIKSVVNHVEEGLRLGYVDNIFFPDMGHSHFFVPQDFFNEVIQPIPISDKKQRYEKMLGNHNVKVLYHTAEQLHMKDRESKALVDDDYIRWRYYSRNLIGYTDGSKKTEIHKRLNRNFNTVRDYPEHRYWGAGFNISASQDGCFSYKDKNGGVKYFDLSLSDLPYDGDTGDLGYL